MTNPEKTIWRTKKIKTVLNSGGPGLSFAPCYGFFLLSSPDIVKIHATLVYIHPTSRGDFERGVPFNAFFLFHSVLYLDLFRENVYYWSLQINC